MRRILVLSTLLVLAACSTSPYEPMGERGPAPPLPVSGPIAYRCSDGTQLMVDVSNNQARVAIVGGPSMVLPNAGPSYYSNGRYGFRGGGEAGQWEVGRAAPVNCRGG
jgi:hypothetical protein